MLCPLRVGWVHFALLAGSHSAFSLKGREGGPAVQGVPSPTQCPRSSCCQVGLGICLILNFATSLSARLNNAASCTGHGHLPWPLVLKGRRLSRKKKRLQEGRRDQEEHNVGKSEPHAWKTGEQNFCFSLPGPWLPPLPPLLLYSERGALLHTQQRQLWDKNLLSSVVMATQSL